MKKAVIITLYDDFNYGNKLQNYAVYKILQSYHIETINLKNNRHLNYDRSIITSYIKFFLSKVKYFIKKRNAYGMKFYQRRKENFKKFSSLIPTSKEYFNYFKLEKYSNYDYYSVGSDQVWNPYMAFDDLTLLKGFKRGIKIAFSASFGVNELEENQKERARKLINDFDFITVREIAGKKICEELLPNKEITVMVDPTMMLAQEEWECIIKKPKVKYNFENKKYILVSFLGNVEDKLKCQIDTLAKANGLEVIYLYEKNSQWTSCGPAEFLFLEKNASLICTDSFHSAVFGIIFNTPILVCGRNGTKENMNSRIETLLSKFDLQSQKYTGVIDNAILQPDFNKANEILDEERKRAKEYFSSIFKEG